MSTGRGSHDPRSTRAPRDLGMPDDDDRRSGIADHVPRDAPEEHLSSYFVRSDGLDNTDASEFCDPTIDTQIARVDAMQATDPPAMATSWTRIDRELTNLAIWLPTVTPNELDLVSRRVGNYRYKPVWGCCSTSSGFASWRG
jgi:hypothetical protein